MVQKIVIDVYGADAGPNPIVDGVAMAVEEGLDFFPVLVGSAELIHKRFESFGIAEGRYEVIDTSDFIGADEKSTVIFGGRNESSMAMAYGYLKENEDCIAMMSPGNTGALVIGAICRLGMVQNIKVPALASALPCSGENMLCLVDCGANVVCTSDELVMLARMGNVFCKCMCGVENPRVGLMSVGREKGKGTPITQEAYSKLEGLDLNFVGNLEGSDMVSDYADVVVADGFSGNLLLKCTEAAGKAALSAVEKLGLEESTMEKIRNAVLEKFEFNSRGAATLLGTKKTVVKMHGCANADTVVSTVKQVLSLEKADFSKLIAEQMSKSL